MTNEHLIEKALADPTVRKLARALAEHPLFQFQPRPDRPELLDQQSSFYTDRFPGLACVLAGNGAGKTYCGSAKVAQFLNETPPPEPNTPFWVLSTTMDLATSNCWAQNLKQFIRPSQVKEVVWYSAARGLPKSIILRPHKNGNNYVLEFKSYDQDRQRLQGANIIGFWADEQAPHEILTEIWARTRRWRYPGSKIYTLTPLQPDTELERCFHEGRQSWKFYRFNTRLNVTLDPKFVQQLTENELEARIETRLTGAFAIYEGAIYPTFDTKRHVIDPFDMPNNWLRIRGLDLGWSHATAAVWGARDLEGRYYIYREYLKVKTSIEDHVNEINADWESWPVRGYTYADPSAAQTLHEFSLRGLHTVSANKDVMAGIATVQSMLRPDKDGNPKLFIFRSCENLIQQLRTYVWDAKKKDQPRKVNDDLADAVRYLCHSHKMDTQINYEPPKIPEKKRRVNF